MVKKADRLAKASKRHSQKEQDEREEAALAGFLVTCRTCMPPHEWARVRGEAERQAGSTFHIVEYIIRELAATKFPVPPSLRKSIDSMLDALGIDRNDCKWEALRHLNYGEYWRTHYGYA